MDFCIAQINDIQKKYANMRLLITSTHMKFKGLFTGLLAGTAVGMFFAPKAGKDIRTGIQKERAAGGTGLNELSKSASAVGTGFWGFLKKNSTKAEKIIKKEIEELKKK